MVNSFSNGPFFYALIYSCIIQVLLCDFLDRVFSYNRLDNKHALLERKDLTCIPKVSYIRGDIYIKKKHLKCYLKCCYILLQFKY